MTKLTDDELMAWLDSLNSLPDHCDAAAECAARFRELLALQEWQPIETAPRECVKSGGKRILVYFPEDTEIGWNSVVCEAFWMKFDRGGASWNYETEGDHRFEDGIEPTHWRPRPDPPKDG